MLLLFCLPANSTAAHSLSQAADHKGSVSVLSSVGAGKPSSPWPPVLERPKARNRMPAVSSMPPVSAAYAAACRLSMPIACRAHQIFNKACERAAS